MLFLITHVALLYSLDVQDYADPRILKSKNNLDKIVTDVKDNFCFVAFRGTCVESISDLFQNFKLETVPIGECMVQQGYWQAATGSEHGESQEFTGK